MRNLFDTMVPFGFPIPVAIRFVEGTTVDIAENLILLAKAYAIVGGVVAAAFILFGMDRVDPASRGSYAFRPLVVPGAVLLWPLVLWRWYRLEMQQREG